MESVEIYTPQDICTIRLNKDCLLNLQICMDCNDGKVKMLTRKIDYLKHTRSTYHNTILELGDVLKINIGDELTEKGNCISEVYDKPRPIQYTKEEMLTQIEEMLRAKGLL